MKLRALSVWTLGPHALTPPAIRFRDLALPLAETYSTRLRPLELPALYSNLHLWIRWEVSEDAALHWRFTDHPDDQFEQGQIVLPAGAERWSQERVERAFALVCRAVLLRLAGLRGWAPSVADEVVPLTELDTSHDVPLVYDPPPAMFLWGGGGPTNDRRTHPYLDRHEEHMSQFHEDAAWWSWWLAVHRGEANLSVAFEGRAGIRVTVNERRVVLGRVRPANTIPDDPAAARELADTDMREALARLIKRLDLQPHPQLR